MLSISGVPTPPATPPSNQTFELPNPIIEGLSDKKQISRITQAFAQYYWRSHFESNPVDPATFLDRVFTDYADYEPDVLGQWLSLDLDAPKMSSLYRLYKTCLNYGVNSGTRAKAAEAKRYQGVCSQVKYLLIVREVFRGNQGFSK